jgi:hypothetical protein
VGLYKVCCNTTAGEICCDEPEGTSTDRVGIVLETGEGMVLETGEA